MAPRKLPFDRGPPARVYRFSTGKDLRARVRACRAGFWPTPAVRSAAVMTTSFMYASSVQISEFA
jgi:hypothetical protein